MNHANPLPVAVIGAGPVGLAAAAHLLARGLEPLVFEAGDAVGASIREWGHVRVFSPWEFNLDPAAVELLERHGWTAPAADGYPTGREIVERYLEPLAAMPEIAARAASRGDGARRHPGGHRQAQGRRSRRRAVRARRRERRRGAALPGERGDRRLGHLDAAEPARRRRTARRRRARARRPHRLRHPRRARRDRARATPASACVVVGSGHSAFNAILDLVALRELRAGDADRLGDPRRRRPAASTAAAATTSCPARGALGAAVRGLVDDGSIALAAGFQTRSVSSRDGDATRRSATASASSSPTR